MISLKHSCTILIDDSDTGLLRNRVISSKVSFSFIVVMMSASRTGSERKILVSMLSIKAVSFALSGILMYVQIGAKLVILFNACNDSVSMMDTPCLGKYFVYFVGRLSLSNPCWSDTRTRFERGAHAATQGFMVWMASKPGCAIVCVHGWLASHPLTWCGAGATRFGWRVDASRVAMLGLPTIREAAFRAQRVHVMVCRVSLEGWLAVRAVTRRSREK